MTIFEIGSDGIPFAFVDPGSDIDYSYACWVEGVIFIAPTTWAILPAIGGVPYNSAINPAPVTIDGVLYDTGKVTSAWIKSLLAGTTYLVTIQATFTGGRKDERSFKLIGKDL